jgi:hypothetical protein
MIATQPDPVDDVGKLHQVGGIWLPITSPHFLGQRMQKLAIIGEAAARIGERRRHLEPRTAPGGARTPRDRKQRIKGDGVSNRSQPGRGARS